MDSTDVFIKAKITVIYLILLYCGYTTGFPVLVKNLDELAKDLFIFNPYESSQRSIMKRQHLVLAHQLSNTNNTDEGTDEGVMEESKNIRGGHSQFEYIPPNNKRILRVFIISEDNKNEMIAKLSKTFKERVPIFEDKAKIEKLELALLKKGIWAVCKWEYPLPQPLTNDEQCRESELKYLLDESFLK